MSNKVLVVDDSGTMRKIIIRALNAVGFTDIVEAADGSLGLAAFQQQPFQLVMTDWNMPNKSGIELTRDIRAMGSWCRSSWSPPKRKRAECLRPSRPASRIILLSHSQPKCCEECWTSTRRL